MLKVNNLHASVGDKEILKGINLEVKAGEVHAIMGPNGSRSNKSQPSIIQLQEIANLLDVDVRVLLKSQKE